VTAIAFHAHAALPNVHASPEQTYRALERILELAEQCSRDARLAVWDIRRPMLTNADFTRAVDTTAQRLVAGTHVALQTAVSGRVYRISPERQGVVLRIVHEAVTNVVRHAGAEHLLLKLAYRPTGMTVTIEDDGTGFDELTRSHAGGGHWGLIGMRERARTVGGDVDVSSTPGAGAVVRLILPHDRAARGAEEETKLVATPYPAAWGAGETSITQ
jgi:signal transduction histidine kinase